MIQIFYSIAKSINSQARRTSCLKVINGTVFSALAVAKKDIANIAIQGLTQLHSLFKLSQNWVQQGLFTLKAGFIDNQT